MSDQPEPVATPAPHRPWLAALLSFILPGLGQAYARRWLVAVVFALPILALLLVAIGAYTDVLGTVRRGLFASDVLVAILIGNGVVLAWRVLAIADAGLTPWSAIRGRERRIALLCVAALLAVTTAMHVWVGAVVIQLDATLGQVFAPDDEPAGDPGSEPGEGDGEPGLEQRPPQWDGTERINILLLGTDAAPGRETALTDVVLVVSADPVTRTAVMISVPRDTGFLPLPDTTVYPTGIYPQRVNSIMARAAEDPDTWCPDLVDRPELCGIRSVERAVGLYLGLEIHHHAIVDMAGFADMIDAIGGVDLCLPGRLVDPEFDDAISGRHADGLVLEAGCRRYDGTDALAYARSRKGWIELPDGTVEGQSDFDRAERQQRVLLAMRNELSRADTLLELPALLSAIGRTVSTDVPRGQAAALASLLPLITGTDIERVVLGYPDFVDLPPNPDENYILIPRRDAIRERMGEIVGPDELVGWFLGGTSELPEEPSAGSSAPPEP